jgi:hypothetical protein
LHDPKNERLQESHISFSLFLILYKFPTTDLAVEQPAGFIEFEDHFNALEAVLVPHEHLAADVNIFAFFVNFQAGVIVDVDPPMNYFSAAAALHGECVESAAIGACRGEDFLEEIHCRSP